MTEASPTRADVEAEFGRDAVVSNPDGSWVARIRDPEQIGRAVSMLDGVRRHDIERGERVRAAEEHVTLRDPRTGRTTSTFARLGEQVATKHGYVEVRKRPRGSTVKKYRINADTLRRERWDRQHGWVED